MNAAYLSQPWFLAVVTTIAVVPLAYAFAWREVLTMSHEHPWQLVGLLVVGGVLALVGATAPYRLGLKRFVPSGRAVEVLGGLAAGTCFGLIGGVSGWIAASYGLWALLIWFFFGSSAVAASAILLGEQHG